MLKNLFKISLLSFLLVISACQKKGNSTTSSSSSFLGDDTAEAVKMIDEANGYLREIKKIYIANQGKLEELSSAMDDKNVAKVKSIADDLVTEINKGLELGNTAVEKIDKARSLDINSTFKQYLAMKAESLRKIIEAFGFRFEAAKFLRDKFGGSDLKEEINKAKAIMTEKNEQFKVAWEEGRSLSQEANAFAAENATKTQ
jgi:hypothetical protein